MSDKARDLAVLLAGLAYQANMRTPEGFRQMTEDIEFNLENALHAERIKAIEECRIAIHLGDWRLDGGWGPFIDNTLGRLKELNHADK